MSALVQEGYLTRLMLYMYNQEHPMVYTAKVPFCDTVNWGFSQVRKRTQKETVRKIEWFSYRTLGQIY
jgi:hypothetical protein